FLPYQTMPYSEQSLHCGQYHPRFIHGAFHAPRGVAVRAVHADPFPIGAKAYIDDEDESSEWAVRGYLASFSIDVIQSR
ncbi:hypothetical protein, partial [Achromobacter sp. GbtcB20]|uniref:hypothetical protein n=1 Tax=Achromobacter sp. GbtcB20 TaxID=2824765 RepID=UPI001C2FB10B